MIYQIRVEGHLGQQWTEWFGGMSITPEENGHTLLTGSIIDDAALYSVLKKVRDLRLPLISVIRIDLGLTPVSDGKLSDDSPLDI